MSNLFFSLSPGACDLALATWPGPRESLPSVYVFDTRTAACLVSLENSIPRHNIYMGLYLTITSKNA